MQTLLVKKVAHRSSCVLLYLDNVVVPIQVQRYLLSDKGLLPFLLLAYAVTIVRIFVGQEPEITVKLIQDLRVQMLARKIPGW